MKHKIIRPKVKLDEFSRDMYKFSCDRILPPIRGFICDSTVSKIASSGGRAFWYMIVVEDLGRLK